MKTKITFTLKPIIHTVETGLKILIAMFLPVAVFILVTSKTEILDGVRSMVVLTGSMQPTIPAGSIVFIEKDNWYMVGDVIAFKNKGDLTVTHRIVEKVPTGEGEMFKVKGDANNTADGDLVQPKVVIGKTFFHIPYIGSFVLFLKTLPGFIALVILPTLIYIGFELWNIKKEIEKETEKRILAKVNASL